MDGDPNLRITGKTWRRVAGVQASSALVQMFDLSTGCGNSCTLLPFAGLYCCYLLPGTAWHRPPVSPWSRCCAPHQWEGHGLVGELWGLPSRVLVRRVWSQDLIRQTVNRTMFGELVWKVSFSAHCHCAIGAEV